MRERLQDPRFSRLVEVFDVDRYNTNATLAENLLFGAPADETFDIEHLAAHPYVQQTLERAGLTDTLVEVGLKVAATMVELFVDLPPDHEYFRQFSFIGADDLPEYRALTTRADPSRLDTLSRDDRERLIALTLQAGAGAASSRFGGRGAAGAGARGAPPVPGASARGAPRQRGVLRCRALHRGGQPPGQHPVRQGRLRPAAGHRAHRRADHAGAGRARPARAGGRGRAAGAAPGSAAAACRWRSGRSWRWPEPS